MNPYLCGVLGFLCQDCVVKIESQFVIVDRINHLFKVLCPHSEHGIVLNFRGCSEATELGFGTIHDLTFPVCLLSRECLAMQCTGAGLASGKVENQGVLCQFGVAFGESECHGSVPLTLIRYRKTRGRSTPW